MTEEVTVEAAPEKPLTELRVLRPFVFTHPADEHTRIAGETRFVPGIYKVPNEIANHPWILAGADGKIESAKQRVARVAEEKARRESDRAEDERIQAESNAAVSRIAKAEAASSTASAAEIEAELNTPVSELKKRGAGAGVTSKTPAAR